MDNDEGALLQAPLDDHWVLARPGGERLLVLNPVAAWIHRARRGGLDISEMARLLAGRFDLAEPDLHRLIEGWLEEWRGALGEIPPVPASVVPSGCSAKTLPQLSKAMETSVLRLADRTIELTIEDRRLTGRLAPILAHLQMPSRQSSNQGPHHRVHLQGTPWRWTLYTDGGHRSGGTAPDAAIVETVAELMDLACCRQERLLVAHGAGLTWRRTDMVELGLLFIGAGGSGKSMLAALLHARGFGLLGDDVIPVDREGRLLGVAMSLCIKEGGWSVLGPYLPQLATLEPIQRGGERARFLPPPGPVAEYPVPLGAFLFPRYRPGCDPHCEPLPPVAVLERLIEAECIIPELNQDRLDALTAWVQSAPAFALEYPDLDSALALLEEALAGMDFSFAARRK